MPDEKKTIDFFNKEQKKSLPVYIAEKTKEDFQTICSRLHTSCNKELNKFIKSFNELHKEVLYAKR